MKWASGVDKKLQVETEGSCGLEQTANVSEAVSFFSRMHPYDLTV